MQESTFVSLFSSLEELVRAAARDMIQALLEDEVSQAIDRLPYCRGGQGYRNGHRDRRLLLATGPLEVSVPRARIQTPGGDEEFRSTLLPRCRRLSKQAQALIFSTYLCGVSTRKVAVALTHVFGPDAVSKSSVSRALQTLRPSWEAFKLRDLSDERIVRLVLDGTVMKVRIDGKSERMSILVALGIRDDGQKVLLSVQEMASESKEAWKTLLEDLSSRGVKPPQLVIVDGSKGLEVALSEVWPLSPVQRCTVHKERNLLAHAPERLHEELKADYTSMMYADTAEQALERRREFLTKWRTKCPKVAKSLEEAGDRLFTFLSFPTQQWKSIRTTNTIERLNEEFRRRSKVQGSHPNGESVCMLLWALIASGAIAMHRVKGWDTLTDPRRTDLEVAA